MFHSLLLCNCVQVVAAAVVPCTGTGRSGRTAPCTHPQKNASLLQQLIIIITIRPTSLLFSLCFPSRPATQPQLSSVMSVCDKEPLVGCNAHQVFWSITEKNMQSFALCDLFCLVGDVIMEASGPPILRGFVIPVTILHNFLSLPVNFQFFSQNKMLWAIAV